MCRYFIVECEIVPVITASDDHKNHCEIMVFDPGTYIVDEAIPTDPSDLFQPDAGQKKPYAVRGYYSRIYK